jgi:exonuclease III
MTSTARIVLRSALKQHESCFKVASINPGSFVAHTDELRYIFDDTSLDALCVSETFFKGPVHNNNAIGLKGFNVFRNDRLKEVYMRMGGVAIFVKSQYKCKTVASSKASDMAEYLFLEVVINTRKLLLGVVYRPPGLNCVSEIRSVLAQMTSCYDQIIVMGDFNINLLSNDSESVAFSSFLLSLKLRVINTEPTHFRASSATLIDFIIVSDNNLDLIKACCQVDLPGTTEHDLLWFAYDLSPCDTGPTTYTFRDYSKLNINTLHLAAHQLSWDEIYLSPNIDFKVENFTHHIANLYNNFIPLKTKMIVHNQTP